MASCWMLTGLVCLALAFIAAAVGFAAPYWVLDGPTLLTTNKYLWARCPTDKCEWFFQNDFKLEKDQPDWLKAVQALYGLGLLTLLIAFIIACVHLCSGCCREVYSVIHAISGLLIFAFLELGVALALFGAKQSPMEEMRSFGWAFYVAIGGAGMTLLAALMYTCAGCRARYQGYTRGDVV